MKFKDKQGLEKEYMPLKDRLITYGFDNHMLSKDESLIRYGHNPKIGSILALKNAVSGLGFLNTPVFQHYSRKYRKRNPVYIEISKIIEVGEWIAFTPSITIDKDTSLSGKMDSLSYGARLFTKFVRLFTGRKDKAQVESLFVSGNSDKFVFSQGYFIAHVEYDENLGDYLIVLRASSEDDEPIIENTFLVSPDILGKTDSVYIST